MLLVKAGIIFGYITNMVVTVAYVEVRDQCHLFGGGGWPSSHSLLRVLKAKEIQRQFGIAWLLLMTPVSFGGLPSKY